MKSRSVTFVSGALKIEGVLTSSPEGKAEHRAAVAIAHPHPLHGGDMESGVVLAITDRLAGLGIPSLRFNFRGVGRSEGRYDDGRGELDDLKAAVSFLGKEEGIDPGKIGLAGYSFGAEIVMRLAVESSARRPVLAVSPVVSSISGRRWNITPGPKLVVCGDSDAFLPAERLRAGTLEEEHLIIDGEDHFWTRKADEMADASGEFFLKAFDLTSLGGDGKK